MKFLFSQLLNEYEDSLSKNDKELLKQLSEQIMTIPNSTINDLADNLYVSTSTLYRLIKKLGYTGFPDFKFKVAESLNTEEILPSSTQDFLNLQLHEIEYTHKINQVNIKKAAKMFLQSNNRYVYGTGWKQGQIASNLATDLLIYDVPTFHLRNKYDLELTAGNAKKEDIFILITLKGLTSEYKAALDILKIKDIPFISISLDTINELSSQSTVSLYYADQQVGQNLEHWTALTLTYLVNLLIQEILQYK